MHGIEEFSIVRGDTLASPAFIENDELKRFNVILANPPYSIKSWDRKSFEKDPYGRNIWGTPPQGCADYAFEQHIQKSLDLNNGRSICLWPQGILDRNSEDEIRKNYVKADRIEAVIGLGRNLFYNSGMESCLLVSRTIKLKKRAGKILFINASDLVKKEKTISYLEKNHIDTIFKAYSDYTDVEGLCRVVSIDEVLSNNASLNIGLYVNKYESIDDSSFTEVFEKWEKTGDELKTSMNHLFDELGKNAL